MSHPSEEPAIIGISKMLVVMIATIGAGYLVHAVTDSTGLSVVASVLMLVITGYLLERNE